MIVDGEILDLNTNRRLKRFDVLADFPIQVNALDYAMPLNILTEQQKIDTVMDLQRRGCVTTNALRFIPQSPMTYVIQINFK